MSKGSVYQYYSSKDELLLNIFMYQSKLLEDRMLMLEREKQPNPRERLISKIRVYLHIWNEHPEFIKMQMRDNTKHTESKELREHMQQMNKFNIETLMESLQDIYGEQFGPYMLDSATLLSSLIFTYMYMKLFDNFPIEIDSLSRYIVTIMDYVAEGMLKHEPEPILNGSMVGFDEEHLKPKQLHPLVLVKQLREAVESLDIDSTEKESWNKQDVLDSIQVLEEELLQVRPRKVILLGMLLNLKEIAPRTSLYERLCKSIEALSGSTPSTLRQ